MSKKYVYFFAPAGAEGKADMKNLLGGKGANVAEMSNLGIPVPAGFTISTEACVEYFEGKNNYPDGLKAEIDSNLKKLETETGKSFGDSENPLLVSVRSGARASMPGMMDTVLNLGLNNETVQGIINKTGNERLGYDSYRRFITMFSDVVLEINKAKFDRVFDTKKESLNVKVDTDLDAGALKEVVSEFKAVVKEEKGIDFPDDPHEQLKMAIEAVFASWNNERAVKYRALYAISASWGTAVNVQSMVFGNMGDTSGTGVAFTRNPSTGERKFYGEFLMNAQGEDVVAGIRTPKPISELDSEMPEVYGQLVDIYKKLELHYKDMQDIEFTIEDRKLFMLQTRSGKRTAASAVRIAVEMVKEGLIDRNTALLRVDAQQLEQLLHPMIDPKAEVTVVAKGLPASPGAAVGTIVFNAARAEERAAEGAKIILVRTETSPEDIGGMDVSQGILTERGGMTSHAAVVARGMGKCCVVGCSEVSIDEAAGTMSVKGKVYEEGESISLDGTTGRVIDGVAPLIEPELSGHFSELMNWADEVRTLKIRTNADTPNDAKVAREFGAEGIGLCRTEHMFFEEERILAVREMILADTREERKKALAKIMPMQKGDFKGIFQSMEGLPVTIRLFDPPLHEFLPHSYDELKDIGNDMGVPFEKIRDKMSTLKELNPMLGHRGCRLGITFPSIYEMQVQSIIEAACELSQEGKTVEPEIMIPLVGHVNELSYTRKRAIEVADRTMAEKGVKLKYTIGTMIELPRAAITADKIAEEADFFSFGTNDLTQTTFGFSRDDIGNFLGFYLENNILKIDPFVSIDRDGVGELIKIGTAKGRKVKPDIKIGICGEHGGEPASIEFCHDIGLDYVSCSPYRVPVARLAAAQAKLGEKNRAALAEPEK